ncbi:hypothetical protein F66182_6286 [Fusarium sp. NRRL 66182]|nr:hypothetical protein F66182_6286 [Fusarium sp. NRRL 66182]
MVYLKTSQEWLDQSIALLDARPSTVYHPCACLAVKTRLTISQTRITTKYKLKAAPSRPDADGDTTVTKPPRAFLVLKAFDPISGTTLKYRTTKAAEVSRLVYASLGRLGRSMAAVPDVPEVSMDDVGGGTAEEPQGAGAATPTPQAAQGGGAGGGGKKKKKGKK